MEKYDEDYFQSQFEKSFKELGASTYDKYKGIIRDYRRVIVPFEVKRMAENQSIVFENSVLEKDKTQLMGKIEKLSSENQQHEQLLESQAAQIHALQRKVEELEKVKEQNGEKISELKTQKKQTEISLEMKVETIKIVEKDKQEVCKKYEQRNDQYNILLANYMRDKNMLAEKLNAMNDLEHLMHEKQKELQAQQFYLKKQWEDLEEEKKNLKQADYVISPNRDLRKKSSSSSSIDVENQELDLRASKRGQKQDHSHEILRTPAKKVYKHHQNEIYSLSFNYNGTLLASCGGDRCIKIFDTINMRNGITIESNSAENIFVSSVLNYGGERLLTGGTDKNITIYNTANGKALQSFLGHGDRINSVTWSCSKEKCVSGASDRQIKVWDIEKVSNLLSISCGKSVKYVTANTVEPVVYSGHTDGSVRIYSITQGKSPISQIKGIIDYPINCVSLLSNRYQALVSSAEGSSLHLLDLKMNKALKVFEHPDFFNTSVQADISPSESYVVAGNCDGSIYYWNVDKKEMQRRVNGHDGPINTLKYNFMTGMVASGDKQGNLIVWQ